MVYRGHAVRARLGTHVHHAGSVLVPLPRSESKLDDAPSAAGIICPHSLQFSSIVDAFFFAGDDASCVLTEDAARSPVRPPERSTPGVGSVSSSVSATTTQLREEKSQLKQRLRAFDLDFKAKHGRLVSALWTSHAT